MARIQDIDIPYLEFGEAAAPGTPAAAVSRLYVKSDGLFYSKDDAGVETLVSGGAGGGSVATDAIWDAAGDLVQGTGANTAAKLTAGTAGQLLKSAGAAAANVWSTAGEFATQTATVATLETTTSTSFAALTTPGPAVTLTVGASGKVSITITCQLSNNTANAFSAVGVAISGATTVAAATWLFHENAASNRFRGSSTRIITGLNAGSTTFTAQYIVESGTGSFEAREIIVEPVI